VKNAFSALLALLVISIFALPVSAALEVLNDDELDSITAAGQPTVVISENGTATQTDESVQTLYLPTDSQVGLRALAITNVAGEAQLLVNLNVISISGDIAGVDQRNFSVQSWGSTLPEIAATADGKPGSVDDNSITVSPLCENLCGALGVINQGDDNDTSSFVTNIASAPVVEIASATGDIIVDGFEGASTTDDSLATLAFEPNAQSDLSALFIANISGRTQAAFNVNIASSTLNLFPGTDAPFTDPAASASAVMKQTNSGVQFRGAPINAAMSIFVDHTP
jgi:hypothetical protein